MTARLRSRRGATVVVALSLVLTMSASAADVPVGVQLPVLANVWKLDRNFRQGSRHTVVVLYQASNAASFAARGEVFRWASKQSAVQCVAVAMDQPDAMRILQTVEADVFYVTKMRGVDVSQIAAAARARKIRTMAEAPEDLARGLSVAIGARDDRPLIMINLEAARAEGAAYQAQLLKLADIVAR